MQYAEPTTPAITRARELIAESECVIRFHEAEGENVIAHELAHARRWVALGELLDATQLEKSISFADAFVLRAGPEVNRASRDLESGAVAGVAHVGVRRFANALRSCVSAHYEATEEIDERALVAA